MGANRAATANLAVPAGNVDDPDLSIGIMNTSETKVKLSPGVGYKVGPLGVELDYDLAGDWAGLNLYYILGNVGE